MPRKNPGSTIHVETDVVDLLIALKRHPRETYNEVIRRTAEHYRDHHGKGVA